MPPWPTSTRTGSCVGRNSATFSSQPAAALLRTKHQAGWIVIGRQTEQRLGTYDNVVLLIKKVRRVSRKDRCPAEAIVGAKRSRGPFPHPPVRSAYGSSGSSSARLLASRTCRPSTKHPRARVPVPESHIRSLLIPDAKPVQK